VEIFAKIAIHYFQKFQVKAVKRGSPSLLGRTYRRKWTRYMSLNMWT